MGARAGVNAEEKRTFLTLLGEGVAGGEMYYIRATKKNMSSVSKFRR
jgi:hypothetical protein